MENSTHLFLINSAYPDIQGQAQMSVIYNFELLNESMLYIRDIPINITIDCFDDSNQLELNYSIMMYTKLNIIKQKKSLKNFTSDYFNSLAINLHDYYSGYNLDTSLLLNSQLVKSYKYSPIIVTQTLNPLNTLNSSVLKTVSDITLIRHLKSALLATTTGQLYLIPSIFEQREIEKLNFIFMENRTCSIMKNYGSQNLLSLLVLGCNSNYPNFMSQLIFALINSTDYTLVDYIVEDLKYIHQSVHIIPGSLEYFAVAIIENNQEDNHLNNYVEIFKFMWKGRTIKATWFMNLNYLSFGWTKFFCMSIDS